MAEPRAESERGWARFLIISFRFQPKNRWRRGRDDHEAEIAWVTVAIRTRVVMKGYVKKCEVT